MVDEIRNKWCEDLEDLLQCPICMMRPPNMIHQCVQGHHICDTCKMQLAVCPTCAQRWSTSRNRLAEHLCIKLNDIKLSLMDPENELNKFSVQTVSTASQTEEAAEEAAPPTTKKGLTIPSGNFPCKIGSCIANRYYEPLLKHLVLNHTPQFQEILTDGPIFEHTWSFDYGEQLVFDRAFLIPNMGTFFLKISSDVFGDLTAFPLMVHNDPIANQFTYQLEISCCDDHEGQIYTNVVHSCRTSGKVLHQKCLRVSCKDMQKLLKHKQQLRCTLRLGKKPSSDHEEGVARPNRSKKSNWTGPHKRQKNGYNGSAGPSNYQPVFNRLGRNPRNPFLRNSHSRDNSLPPSRTASLSSEFRRSQDQFDFD